ncbi:hypothetical protein HWV62_37651 [Athelia sp. TMB]|nr:hypothetical protein HWV62_37651 [Athelia sp. TMB]
MSSPDRSPTIESIDSSALSGSDEDFKLESASLVCDECSQSQNARPMGSNHGCGQANVTVDEWEEFNKWKQQRGGLQITSIPIERASVVPKSQYTEHAHFFLPAMNIFFLVASTLYSIPRAPFEWHSAAFAGKGLTREAPLVVQGVDLAHFDHFLSIIYPLEYGHFSATTVEEWTAILRLAETWSIKSIRTLAIDHLSPIATDIDKIILGREFRVDQWLGAAYLAVCQRENSLTEEEGNRMTVGDIIKISAIRQQFGLGARPTAAIPLLLEEVCIRFGLMSLDSGLLPPGEESTGPGAAATCSSSTNPLDFSDSEATFLHDIAIRRAAGMGGANSKHASSGSDPAEFQLKDHQAAERMRAMRARDREMSERALQNYFDSPQFSKLDSRRRQALRDARAAMQLEDGKRELLDAIASYQADTSNAQ